MRMLQKRYEAVSDGPYCLIWFKSFGYLHLLRMLNLSLITLIPLRPFGWMTTCLGAL